MVPSSGRWYGVTGHVIGWPRRSTVVYSVVMKRSKTAWTSPGSDAVIAARVYGRPAAGSARSAARPPPHADVLAPGPALLCHESPRELVVRGDRQRDRVPALHEHLVEQAAVLEPDVREQPAVAVPRLASHLVAHARAGPQHRLRERGRL